MQIPQGIKLKPKASPELNVCWDQLKSPIRYTQEFYLAWLPLLYEIVSNKID